MQIDSIEAVTKDRCRVTLDSGEKFILYKGEIRMLKLKPEMELSNEVYLQIMKGILTKRSKLRAMNLLKSRDYTEYQLAKKLLDAEYPQEIVDQAIDYVKAFGYIDDKRYAVSYIKEQYDKHSRKEVQMKLQQKGIDKTILDEAFKDTYGGESEYEDTVYDETSLILKTLQKKHFRKDAPYEDKQKVLAYFYRRGFSMDAVYKAIDMLEE